MIYSLSKKNRRKAAAAFDYLLCMGGVYHCATSLNYYLFGLILIVTVLLYEIFTVALFQKTLGHVLLKFQVIFSQPSQRWSCSVKRSCLFCWHMFFVFWPEDPDSPEQQGTEQGLVVYKWESGSGTYLKDLL